MAGLLLLVVLGIWIVLAGYIAALLTGRWRNQTKRVWYGLLAFVLVLPLPFLDEIIGGFQLRALCREGTVPKYDEAKARGRTVYVRLEPNPEVPSVMETPSRRVFSPLPIIEKQVDWLDADTNEVVLSFKWYEAKGGWFSRVLMISGGAPLLISRTSCRPNETEIFRKLNVQFR